MLTGLMTMKLICPEQYAEMILVSGYNTKGF